jgi:hypothetical protein
MEEHIGVLASGPALAPLSSAGAHAAAAPDVKQLPVSSMTHPPLPEERHFIAALAAAGTRYDSSREQMVLLRHGIKPESGSTWFAAASSCEHALKSPASLLQARLPSIPGMSISRNGPSGPRGKSPLSSPPIVLSDPSSPEELPGGVNPAEFEWHDNASAPATSAADTVTIVPEAKSRRCGLRCIGDLVIGST